MYFIVAFRKAFVNLNLPQLTSTDLNLPSHKVLHKVLPPNAILVPGALAAKAQLGVVGSGLSTHLLR